MKIGFFITARLKSTRLQKKILLDLNGKTVLDRVIERCKVVNTDGVVLCTSTNPQDSELYDYALKNQIQFYSGSEDDVLQRLYDAARYYNYDGFLSITADNPLHSYYIGSIVLDYVLKYNFDFVFTNGLPVGLAPYYLKTNALEIALKMKAKTNTEIWGPFVNRPDFFNVCNINVRKYSIPASTRLTCDYINDFKLFRAIYRNYDKNSVPSIFDIEDLLSLKKEYLYLNKNISQNSVPISILNEIRNNFDKNIELGKNEIIKSKYQIKPGSITVQLDL